MTKTWKSSSSFLRYGVAVILLICVIAIAFPFIPITTTSSLSLLYHPDPISNIEHPRFSSDETTIAFTTCSPCKVSICSIASEKTLRLSPRKEESIYDVVFHPTTDKIAFILFRKLSNGNTDYQIAESNIDGTGTKVLTSSDTSKQFPEYSFDGGKILFQGKPRCEKKPTEYCRADLYEYDVGTKRERRLTDLQGLQVAPASFFPGNGKIALTAFGSVYSRIRGYESRIDLEKVYGQNKAFVLDVNEPDRLYPVATNTPTASSPKALPSGETAFLSRVNEYDNTKKGYVYDVFLLGPTGSRRLTNLSRYVRDYAISNSSNSVAFVTESNEKPARAELLLWNKDQGSIRKLQCGSSIEERTLVP